MPFKSKAQRRKFAELLIKGEITPEAYEEWNRSTGSKKLPERVRPKTAKGAKRKKATDKRATKKKVTRKKAKRQAAGKRKTAAKRA
jgi:hypothetical protein